MSSSFLSAVDASLDEESESIPKEGLVSTGESNWCLFCGSDSKKFRHVDKCDMYPLSDKCRILKTLKVLQRKKISNVLNSNSINHFSCSICKKKVCLNCAMAICRKMEVNNDHHGDLWYHNVISNYDTNSSNSFIGHCCEIRSNIANCKGNITKENSKFGLRYDGYIHLPQLGLLIPPPILTHIDIHAFGKETHNGIPSLLHAVVGYSTSSKCMEDNVIPDNSNSKIISKLQLPIEIQDINDKILKVNCHIDTYLMGVKMETKNIQHKSVSVENITGSKIVQEPESSGIWIILAKVNKYDSKAQLVNVRLPSKLSKTDYSEDYVKQLYNDVKELIPRNALECTRTSGSNGETTYRNRNILKLLKSNSAFPRKGKGVKLVRRQNYWRCYYLAPGNQSCKTYQNKHKIACWKYPQPNIG